MKGTDSGELSKRTLLLYALPAAGMTAMHWLVLIFLLKYSTDVVGLAPVLVGSIFAASRMWDAVSDPLVGWMSDRTHSRWGRRRPWLIASALPVALCFCGLWSTPAGASPVQAAIWLAVALFLFYSASTASRIPYLALGAELTGNHHERTRLSAVRVGSEIVGIFTALAGLHWIENATSVREVAGITAGLVAVAAAGSLVYAGLRLPEPATNQGRGAAHPGRALRDVLRNPHARRLTAALFLAEVGLGALLVAVPYVTEMMGRPGTSAVTMLAFMLPFAAAVPLWIPVTRRFGKGRCFTVATGMCATSFILLGLGAWQSELLYLVSMTLIGISQAAMRTLPESIKADVIDWDEARTGERKEGTYFAAWNLADKAAGAMSVALVGFVIQGADGGVSADGIRLATSYVPAGLLLLSTAVMLGFRLGAREHGEIRSRIQARRFGAGAVEPQAAARTDWPQEASALDVEGVSAAC